MSRALALGLSLIAATSHAGTISTTPPDPENWLRINTSQEPEGGTNFWHRENATGIPRYIIQEPTIWVQRTILVNTVVDLYVGPASGPGSAASIWINQAEMALAEMDLHIADQGGGAYLFTNTSAAGVRQYVRTLASVPEPSALALACCGVLAFGRHRR